MKRFIKTALTVVLAVAAAACTRELEPQKENINGTIDLSVTGVINGYTSQEETKAEAQTVVRIMWKGDETVYVFDGTKCLGSLTASIEGKDSTYAKLSGTISETEATTLTFVYSPQFDAERDFTEGKISLDLSTQNGEEVPFLIYATLPTAQAPTSFINEVVQFYLATSVFKCNCAGLVGEGEISQAAISGVNTKCELTLSAIGAPEVSGTTPGTITRTAGFTQADQRAIFSVALPKTTATEADRTIEVTKGVRTFTASYPSKAFDVSKSFNSVFALEAVPYSAIPFTITSTGSTTVAINGGVENINNIIKLKYRVGSGVWKKYDITPDGGDGDVVGKTITLNDGESLQFRAEKGGNETFSTNDYRFTYRITVEGEGEISASGNIMSLLDSTLVRTELKEYIFARLFDGCDKLTDASNLILPATTLENECYRSMFSGCSSLKTAPALPATELEESCYGDMFYGCSNLKTAPSLPATTLAASCYSGMFSESGLTTAPVLPATTMVENCYLSMFSDCSSLEIAPTLPATSLASQCYQRMFSGCSGLTAAPTLPATSLAEMCYYAMFENCTSLAVPPTLPATSLAEYCYQEMFIGCAGLKMAPYLPATELKDNCYEGMFSGCSSLEIAPDLPASKLTFCCYYNMFSGCAGLKMAPALPATKLADNCYSGMFFGCSDLTSAPDLLATQLEESCYSGMFSGCSSLKTAPALPATTLEISCYSQMFSGCTSLIDAPVLPATSLKWGCYSYMFSGCSSLKYVEALFEDTEQLSDFLDHWLENVAESGTFVRNANATWDETEYVERAAYGIPANWEVKTKNSPSPGSTETDPEETVL